MAFFGVEVGTAVTGRHVAFSFWVVAMYLFPYVWLSLCGRLCVYTTLYLFTTPASRLFVVSVRSSKRSSGLWKCRDETPPCMTALPLTLSEYGCAAHAALFPMQGSLAAARLATL